MANDITKQALDYHAHPKPGKLAIHVTKPCTTQKELSLAYTPGVAEPVREIAKNPESAYRYTAKGNLVAVVSDGTAVLGLGDVGALAGKPVMEGKAVLFKRFAGIDCFDIEINSKNAQHLIETIEAIAPTFGGINLEDIAAPTCFEVEKELQKRLDIPVFHDDQHGTAIIVAAALLNALEIQRKKIEEIRIVCLGAGAAGIASMNLLVAMGVKKQNMMLVDRSGVIHSERTDLNPYKQLYASKTSLRTLADAMQNADVFIGVSGANLVSAEMVKSMAARPIVFALSNPDPEIRPEIALKARSDLIMATGRSDFPNQVNNALGFPYIFRGALDVRAKMINQEMIIACVKALSALAKEPVPADVLHAYNLKSLQYGPDYIIPKPLDPRLIDRIPPAIAQAAIDSGIARTSYPAHYPK